jgi:hypothetical protein
MSNPNKDKFQQTINTRKATPDEIAYRNGYTRGRNSDRKVTYTTPIVRDANNTANGVLLGILLASLVGIITATFFILTKQEQPAVVETPLPQQTLPQSAQPNVVQPQPVQRETTVIERTTDRVQEVVPAAPPDVQITVPTTQPSATANPSPSSVAPSQTTTPQVNSQPSVQDTQPQTNVTPTPSVSNQNTTGQE